MSGLLATGTICGLTTQHVVVVNTVAGGTQNMFFDNRLTSYVQFNVHKSEICGFLVWSPAAVHVH